MQMFHASVTASEGFCRNRATCCCSGGSARILQLCHWRTMQILTAAIGLHLHEVRLMCMKHIRCVELTPNAGWAELAGMFIEESHVEQQMPAWPP